jgi:hypothetical protein
MESNMEKRHYPNLLLALKDRDKLWRNKGRRLRVYKGIDGRFYLTSMDSQDYWEKKISKECSKECTEANLVSFIYKHYEKNGSYPSVDTVMRFFEVNEELMEVFLSDSSVFVVGNIVVPFSDIEEIYKTHVEGRSE